jgi:hypothetical protein
VPVEPASDLGLGQVVVAIQRPHQPALLELGEPALLVQRRELDLGVDAVGDFGEVIATLDQPSAHAARSGIKSVEVWT